MSSGTRWATRCNACGTSFRVQEEQLAASDGYVRCGRCDAVFNARSTLFDLDASAGGAPVSASAAADNEAPLTTGPVGETEAGEQAVSALADAAVDARSAHAQPQEESPSFGLHADGTPGTAWTATSAASEPSDGPLREPAEPVWRDAPEPRGVGDARTEPDWQEPDAGRMLELLGADSAGAASVTPTDSASPATWNSLREHRPRPPESRLALAGLSLVSALLVLALPVHWAWIEREPLRAQHAELDALLAEKAAVPSMGWRHLDGLQVSSSSLRATPQGGAYQLELVVMNRAAHRLAMPWLDLSLSDSKGQPLLRRSLDPALLGPIQALGPNEQRKLQIVFRVDRPSAVAGYEIGLFHP